MLNWIWLGLILVAVVYAAFTGRMQEVSAATFDGAKEAVELVIGLAGPMILFLGLMRVAQDGGLLLAIARGLKPILRRAFPDVPEDHPAIGAMVMNLASNVLGLGNAATPFGLKAMAELDRLNPRPGVASDSMILFLAINTSAITLFPPTGTMSVRAAAGSSAPEEIWIPTLIATTCSTVAAIAAYFALRRLRPARETAPEFEDEPALGIEPVPDTPDLESTSVRQPAGLRGWLVVGAFAVALAVGLGVEAQRLLAEMSAGAAAKEILLTWMLPLLIAGLLLIGVAGRIRVYESMVAGARDGLQIVVRIVPYLVAILAAVAMFRASGALDLLMDAAAPLTGLIGFPEGALPVALLRPLSGSGTFAVMSEVLNTYGADSFTGRVASTLMGSTETTFYVLALYLGAARVRDARFAVAACLIGDVAGFFGATAACHLFFG